ncbi:hypothetical protein PX699_00490 [Sphingobium sp. H39-3-25]|uniref:hypothetical protein n=1 Tax=Sphingobium arseniciresistens TaxID=3030834 RepID=UPI0023B96D81|nr:hypothetical protein [Sphingobium arseniciresistens]
MSFIDFKARYNQVGRVMLADLAEIYDVDFDLAERWADEIDQETHSNIAGANSKPRSGGQGGGGGPLSTPPPPALHP